MGLIKHEALIYTMFLLAVVINYNVANKCSALV